jgi:hypothetical protein
MVGIVAERVRRSGLFTVPSIGDYNISDGRPS